MEEEESHSAPEEEEDAPTTLPLYKRGGPDGLSIMDQVTPRYYGSSPSKEPAPRYYRNTEKEEQLFKCVECDKLFTRKSNLKTHMKNHYDGAKITCEMCNQQFLDRSNFNRHMNAKHPKDKTAIRKRRKVSPLKVRAPCSPETDIRVDGEPNKLTIKLEDDGREEDGREEEEYSEEECTAGGGSNRMTCKVCLRQFMDKESLVCHEEKYGGKKNYKCSTCDKCFHYRTSWIRHEECHKTERKVWPCDTCDMTFTQKVNLKRHKEGNKNPCNGEFREGGLYKNPNGEFRVWTEGQNRGTEVRKKDCNNRTQRRQSSQAVNEGLRLDHVYSNLRDNESEDEDDDLLDDEVEDEKQTASDNAEDNTTTSNSINNDHIQKGVSLYACNYCGKVFHYRSLWTRHEKEHLSSHKSFQCHICGTKFTRQFYLSKHRKVCFRSRLGNAS